ncbi:BnaC07g33470D [Brassica napus]|uniref:BnaC07g33470D protein n=1 Tax=Brassica napus TaxID=3708 RepID=A0A078F9M1_BRANA|nr:BnaC07g33470D [Brassica napus]
MLPVNRTSALLLTILTQIKALHHTQQVHAKVILHGLQEEVLLGSSLTNSYIQSNRLDLAAASFHRIPPRKRNRYSWNTILSGHSKSKNHRESLRLYNLMRKDCNVDSFNLVFAIKACFGRVEDARKVFDEITLKSSVLWGVLMKGYLRYSSDSEVFRLELFQKSVDKNVVMWTTLVSGFAKCERAVEAFDLFREMMLGERVLPNQCTLAAVLVACSSLGSQRHGKSVHGHMIRNGIEMDAVNYTSFIDMYARCGNVQMARKVFDMMPERNVISWSSMVNAFGINGKFEEALGCFGKMKSQNLTPNSVTFVSLLSACSHSGNIEEGRKQFVSMTRDYGIAPEEEHYACMVDLLGRGGEIGEAKSFIDNMPVEPMASAWGALLNACRIHKKVELAEEIAEKLLSMGSNESSVYVLLSNIYADAGMWEMVNSVRRKMGIKGYRKPMGLSAIERLRAVINELESLKPEFDRRVDELNRADDEPYSVVGSGFPGISYSSDAVEWPPVNRASYFRPGDINKPALRTTSQTSGLYNSKPIDQQFQKLQAPYMSLVFLLCLYLFCNHNNFDDVWVLVTKNKLPF